MPSKDRTRLLRHRLRAAWLCAIVASASASAGVHSATAVHTAHAETEATTYYVAPGGNDGGACNSAAAPCGTIQAAVNKSASGDTIQIAAGTYTFSVDQCGSGVNAVVCIAEKSLTLIGAGAGATIIDGGGARRGVAVLGSGVKPLVRVQNLTIRNGLAVPFGGYAATGQSQGGGMLVNNASVALSNLQFLNNRSVGVDVGAQAGGIGAGGGLSILWIPGQLPTQDNVLENVVFDGNQAAGSNGSVRGGEAQGGAVFTYYARVSATGLTVRNNVAQAGSSGGAGNTNGQAADGLGGGIAAQEASNVSIASSTFTNNQARGGNAGQSGGNAFGGGIFGERATLSLTALDLRENEAVGGNGAAGGVGGGGAVSHDSTTMTLARSTIVNNSSSGGNGNTAGAGGGGGIYITRFTNNNASSTIVNTIIADNATQQGSGATAGGGGGGIWVQGLTLNLTHVTLARNTAGSSTLGHAMIINDFGAPAPSITNLNFSIVAEHSGGSTAAIIVEGGNTLNLNRGLWAANSTNTGTFASAPPNPAATINGAGSMVSAGSAGFVSPGGPDYNYRITNGSPALNQATGSTTPDDIDGNSRPQGSAHDIGADEVFVLPPNLRPYAYTAILVK